MIYYHIHGLRFEFACLSVPLGCLTLCVRRNLAINDNNDNDDDDIDDDNVSAYVVASPTSRFALVFTMPTRPCMCNAFLVLSKDIMRNRRRKKYPV